MKALPTAIPGVLILEPRVFGDERGFFFESWNRRSFLEAGIDADFVQDNQSRSRQWALRGLHYQVVKPQGKLVRVLSGAVYDVAVDLRRSSPAYGRSVGVELSAGNQRMLWLPPGCAHGFLTLSEQADFAYKATDYWHPEHERVIRWSDPDLAIDWQLPAGVAPVLSERDARGGTFRDAESYP